MYILNRSPAKLKFNVLKRTLLMYRNYSLDNQQSTTFKRNYLLSYQSVIFFLFLSIKCFIKIVFLVLERATCRHISHHWVELKQNATFIPYLLELLIAML